jgi:helix-turn-helix protein
MGRNEKPIGSVDPVGSFAGRLRHRRVQAGTPTYRVLAGRCHYSHSVLADAAAGHRLPTWEVTEAFLRACGAGDDELAGWRRDWTRTHQLVGDLRRRLADSASTRVAVGRSPQPLTRGAQLRPVQPALAGPDQYTPRPTAVQTYDDLVYQLNVLHIAAGKPSMRQLSRASGHLFGASTACEVLGGRRVPGYDLYTALVQTLLARYPDQPEHNSDGGSSSNDLAAWQKAWTRADFNRDRPDLFRRRRYGNLYVMTSAEDQGPTPDIIAEMPTEVAAALLSSLDKRVAAQIISEMPSARAGELVTTMWGLTGRTSPNGASPSPATPRDTTADPDGWPVPPARGQVG